jgi:WD40 repeat protein
MYNLGTAMHKIDTGSQVCNLMWSKKFNEIVSTHGYSLNQIIVWRYPTMQKLTTLTGHTLRVLYLAMSPDGQSVVTGAGMNNLFKILNNLHAYLLIYFIYIIKIILLIRRRNIKILEFIS